MESIFTNIYENKHWGDNGRSEYNGSSGSGSDVEYNISTYVPLVKNIIRKLDIKSVNDMGCGDFRCGDLIYDEFDISYYGYDVYKKVVDYNNHTYKRKNRYSFNMDPGNQLVYHKYTFRHLDFCTYKTEIRKADLIILKDVLQHWRLHDIYDFLDYICAHKIAKYILICNCCNQTCDNTDIPAGSCRGLSAKYYPLKKYSPEIIYYYQTKEVSIIKVY